MLRSFDPRAGLIALIFNLIALAASADPLTLAEAQAIALARDSGRLSLTSEASAMRELAVAAAQLPDPEARIGAVNVPLDPLALDREDMTMIEFGLHQRLPRSRSRSLERERMEHHALGLDAETAERARSVDLAVARSWRELDFIEESLAILEQERQWAGLQVAGQGASYASGEGSQAALLEARVLVLEIDEQQLALQARRQAGIAELRRWLGDEASRLRLAEPAADRAMPLAGELESRLARHPWLLNRQHQTGSAEIEIALTRQRYKPSFGVDLAYGLRQGAAMGGGSRPDLFSAMLTFDVPLFTRDRQDRELAAARSRTRSAESRHEDFARELLARLHTTIAEATRLGATLSLYQDELSPLAEAAVAAEMAGYRTGEGSLATVAEAQRKRLEVRQKTARLRADLGLAQAELQYLTGVAP